MASIRLCARRLFQVERHNKRGISMHAVLSNMFFLNDPKAGIDRNSFTQATESKEEFKYVEKILPNLAVPEPPKHDHYPTPSGWIPPAERGLQNDYFVERTRYHNLPVYTEETDGGTRKLTKIARVKGDIWKFEMALRTFLLKYIEEKELYTQVDEVREFVRVRGFHVEPVVEFLLEKGF